MKKYYLFFVELLLLLIFPLKVYAHCPLCTIGAGAVAVVAAYLGVGYAPIGIFIGAFGMALGLWIAGKIKKKYLPFQDFLIGLLSFLLTIVPLRMMFQEYLPLYISWFGDYGSWFNRTYLFNKFIIGSIIGGVLVLISPLLSDWLSKLRKGEKFRFQKMVLTFIILFLAALILQFTT